MAFLADLGAGVASGAIGGLLGGIGTLAKDLRAAITGKEPIDATKAAELALKVQELEASIEHARLSVMLAESASQDKWTSRGRPLFLYVMYIFLLAGIPMGALSVFRPEMSTQVALGMQAWLAAIPGEMWWLFGAGYLGYTTARGYEKVKGASK